MASSFMPAALSIAGSDSGGAAGIQADLLSFAANGVYGATAITCLTAQNPTSVSAIEAACATFVAKQIEQVLAYYPIKAIKTGMLFNEEIIRAVSRQLASAPDIPVVVDPVSVATSGAVLLHPSAIDALKSELLPRATILTPNLDETKLLLGRDITSPDEMESAVRELADTYQTTVLVKGGHLAGDTLVDIAADPSGELRRYQQSRIQKIDTHGSGCTLSSAIAAHLAKGCSTFGAIEEGLHYLRRCMDSPLLLPQSPFINHFP